MFLFFSLVSHIHLAQIIYVDQSATGANDGTSWTNAYTDLQDALMNVSPFETIWVAQGVYLPHACNPCTQAEREAAFFLLNSDVNLFGGFNGTETNLNQRDIVANPTILSGDIGVPGDSLDNAYHVVVADMVNNNTVLDGFIIEEGNANGSFDTGPYGGISGGGLFVNAEGGGSDPTISNCIFRNNYAGGGGGVILYCILGGSTNAVFSNCTFTGNTASLEVISSGAAVTCFGNAGAQIFPQFLDCNFTDNYVGNDGGAIAATPSGAGTVIGMTVFNCTFNNNEATDRGGAVWMRVTSDATNQSWFSGCTFIGNIAGGQGGAIYERASFGATSNVTYDFCTISGNIASGTSTINPGDGGGIYLRGSQSGGTIQSTLDNCTIVNNQANRNGGGVVLHGFESSSCSPTFNTISIGDNQAGEQGGGVYFLIEDAGAVTTTFNDCMIEANVSLEGGGICFSPESLQSGSLDLTLLNSSISSNIVNYGSPADGFFAGGGGILISIPPGATFSTNLNIDFCAINNNSAIGGGGGILFQILNAMTFNPIITNTSFIGNFASQQIVSSGGGIAFFANSGAQITPTISGCMFSGNYCVNNDGGAISAPISGVGTVFDPVIENCVFTGNFAEDRGAGLWWRATSDAILSGIVRNCTFDGNSAGGNGGAVYHRASFNSTSNTQFLECVFRFNQSVTPNISSFEDGGGAMYIRGTQDGTNEALVANCLFQGNVSSQAGNTVYAGAILISSTLNNASPGICSPLIVNNTFVQNSGGTVGSIYMASSSPAIHNNIFWSATPIEQLDGINQNPVITHNIIQLDYSGPGTVSNNLTDDPLFADPSNGDYHLTACSPAIDAGSNAALPPVASSTDLDGTSRILNSIVDLGAFEFDGIVQPLALEIDSSNVSCFGGCDGQASVNVVSGVPGYTYEWSNGSTTALIEDLCPGTYTVSVTDNNACVRIDSVTISEPPPVALETSNDTIICANQTVTIQATATGGTGNFSFSWNEGLGTGDSHIVNPSESTTYIVTLVENGQCTFVDSVLIGILPGPEVEISGDTAYCAGDSLMLDAGGFQSYMWSTNETSQQITVTSPGVYSVSVMDASGCAGIDELTVIENQLPTPVITGELTFCQGAATQLDAGTFVMHQWSSGQFDQSIMVSSAGNYAVTVTDHNGCSGNTAVNVTASIPPDPSITGVTDICEGESTQLDAGTFDSYDWSTADTTQTITVNNAGNFTVTVTDVSGCTGTDAIMVSQSAAPTPSIVGDPDFCAGGMTTLDAGSFDGYEWSNSGMSQTIDVSSPGLYGVTVTDDNGCTGTDTFTVIENPLPTPAISGTLSFCEGESTQLDAGTYAGYDWSTGDDDQFITVDEGGLITVTVTDLNGCSGTTAVVIDELNPPAPSIFGDTEICPGSSTQLDAGLFAGYEWSTNQENQTIEVGLPGVYSVVVTDGNGCTGSDEVEINELPAPQPDIQGDLELCPGENTLLDAGDFTFYEWSTDVFTQTIVVNAPGQYTVTVTDLNECTGEQTVEVVELLPPTPAISGDLGLCAGLNTELDAGAFQSYQWSTGDTTQVITVNTVGFYSVTVSDLNGCSGTNEVFVEEFDPQPGILGQLSICFGNTTTLVVDGFAGYEWSNDSTSNEIEVGTEGFYAVTVTDQNGCTGTDEVFVAVTDALEPSITGGTIVCSNAETILDAGVFDQYNWSTGSASQQISVDAPGTYIVTVSDNSGCSGTASIELTSAQAPEPVIAGQLSACSSENIELTVDAYESYNWSNGETDQNITVLSGGIYLVTVTDQNGCTGTDEVVVDIFQDPQPVIFGDNGFCSGDSLLLYLDPFDDYAWSNGLDEDSIFINQSGIYTITVTDQNGCTGTDEIIVDEFPSVDGEIGGIFSFCTGGSTILNVTSAQNIEWSTGSNGNSILVTTPGTYSVVVSNNFGCMDMDTVEVVENDVLQPVIEGGNHLCFGDTLELSAELFDQYAWSNGETDASITVTEGGLYILTVTDASGCTGEDALLVTESEALDPVIAGPVDFCAGDTIQLSIGLFNGYAWSNGAANQSILVHDGGTYTLTVTDASGCTATAETSVSENDPPVPAISGSTSFCTGGSTILVAGNFQSYIWSTGDTGNEITVDTEGTYAVTVTDVNGCSGSDEILVTEEEELMPTILGDLVFCFGDSTQLSTGSFASLLWSDGSTGNALTVNEPGTYSVTVTDVNGCTGAVSADVVETEEVDVNISGDSTFCHGQSTTLYAGVFQSFLWSTGENSQLIEVSESGVYGVTVTDSNGCLGEGTVEVTEIAELSPEISGATSICTGNNTQLEVSGFNAYQWSTGDTSQQIIVSESGMYVVTVTDLNGCTGTAVTEITVSEQLMPEISGLLFICEGANTMLDAGTYEGYQWSTGEITQEIEVMESGIYSVTVTDGTGCTGETNVEVTEFDRPMPEIQGELNICSGSFTNLDAGSFVSYLWSTGDQTPVITVAENGSYRVTVTDENGCTGETSVEVTVEEELMTEISGSLSICEGSSTVLDAGMFETYEWSTGETGAQIEVTSSGAYAVTVSDASGCTGEASVEVTVGEDLMPIISGATSICAGSSAVLDAGNFDAYFWSTGETGQQIEIAEPGLYAVTVSDGNGCTGFTTVQVDQADPLFPEIEGPALFCPGENVTLSTGAYVMYQWSTGAVSSEIQVSSPGTYAVTVTDEDGCSGETAISVDLLDPPVIDAGEDVIIRTEKAVTLNATGGVSYSWSGPSEFISCFNCSETMVTPNETATFYVTGTDQNGCEATDSVTVFVVIDLELDPVNTITPNGDGRNDVFYVRGLEPFENAKLTVFNRWGDVLYSSASYQNDWEGTYNGKPIPAGAYLYLLRVQVFDQVYELKGTINVIRE